MTVLKWAWKPDGLVLTGKQDDIGGAMAALLTGEIQWVTGQRIEVSGGQNL